MERQNRMKQPQPSAYALEKLKEPRVCGVCQKDISAMHWMRKFCSSRCKDMAPKLASKQGESA